MLLFYSSENHTVSFLTNQENWFDHFLIWFGTPKYMILFNIFSWLLWEKSNYHYGGAYNTTNDPGSISPNTSLWKSGY